MTGRAQKLAARALVLAGTGLSAGCGDEDPTGPQFGNLVFTPRSTILAGDERDAVLLLRNNGPRALGPITIGLDVIIRSPRTEPDSFCTGARLDFVPSTISSLAEGEDQAVIVSIDLNNPEVTPSSCPPGGYEEGVLAFLTD